MDELGGLGVLIGMGGGAAFGAIASSGAQIMVQWFKGRASKALNSALGGDKDREEENKLLEYIERSYRDDA